MSVDYDIIDFGVVSNLLSNWAPVGVSSWRGTIEPNRPLPADTAVTGDQANPAMFASWEITYDTTEGTFDLVSNPVRTGSVMMGVYIELNAGRGLVNSVVKQLRDVFASSSSPVISFSPDLALIVRFGAIGVYNVYILKVPFTGV